MSVKIMGIVWDADLPPVEKLVLLAFADHADHEGRNIYPSNGLIAHKTGLSVRQAERYRARFVRRGVMVRDGRSPFKTNSYRLNLDALTMREPFSGQNRRGRPAINTDMGDGNYSENADMGDGNYSKIPTSSAINADMGDGNYAKMPTSSAENADIAMSIKPSLTVNTSEPSIKPSDSIFQTLEGAHYTPAQAWLMTVDQLRQEMPKAAYETYVTGARLVDFYSNRAVIAVSSEYSATWLNSRLSSSAARLLTGILNRSVTVEFQLALFGAMPERENP